MIEITILLCCSARALEILRQDSPFAINPASEGIVEVNEVVDRQAAPAKQVSSYKYKVPAHRTWKDQTANNEVTSKHMVSSTNSSCISPHIYMTGVAMASNNSRPNNLTSINALTSSVPLNAPSSQHAKPVRKSARVMRRTASAEDAKRIDKQLTFLYADRYDHNDQAFPYFKAASEVTANFYQAQDSTLLSIPTEIRANIFKLALDGANEDSPENMSFVRLPKLVLTCKQFLTEVPSIFYQVNTFAFAVGSNWTYTYARNENDRNFKSAHSHSGTLGLNSQQSKAASAGVSEIRLHAFILRIWTHFRIDDVRSSMTARRKGNEVKLSPFSCAAHLTIVGGRLVLQMEDPWQWLSLLPEYWGYESWLPKGTVDVMQRAIQTVVDEINESENLKRGLELRDVMRLAAALRFSRKKA